MFILVGDRDKDQDALFPVVTVVFSVTVIFYVRPLSYSHAVWETFCIVPVAAKKNSKITGNHWDVLPVVGPGILREAPTSMVGVPAYYLANFFPKTAWKWKKLNQGWCPPLDPSMVKHRLLNTDYTAQMKSIENWINVQFLFCDISWITHCVSLHMASS